MSSKTSPVARPFWKAIPRFDREFSTWDLFRAAGALVHGNGARQGEIEHLFPSARYYFLRSGRECLYVILKMLKLPPKSRVGVPLYCCASVFEAIAGAGHIPFFLDIDLDTYALDEADLRRQGGRLDALIVVHTFGYPAHVPRLRDCLGGRMIPIVEDCAHALFSECEGQQAGTLGDASFLTFGLHKPAAAGGGAVLLINDSASARTAEREFPKLGIDSRKQEFSHSLACWTRSFFYRRATYGALLASPLGRFRDQERGVPEENQVVTIGQAWSPGKIRRVDKILIPSRMDEFRKKSAILAENTRKLREQIRESVLAIPTEPSHGLWNHFMVPVRYPNRKRREIGRQFLRKMAIDTSPLFQNCTRNARWFGYEGGCPSAERAGETVCTVPNHAWLSDDEIAYVGECVRQSADWH